MGPQKITDSNTEIKITSVFQFFSQKIKVSYKIEHNTHVYHAMRVHECALLTLPVTL
jgi:hypothetical protein